MINPTEKLWEFILINNGKKELVKMNHEILYGLEAELENSTLEEVQQKIKVNDVIQNHIQNYERSKALATWNDASIEVFEELQHKHPKLIGKIMESIFKSDSAKPKELLVVLNDVVLGDLGDDDYAAVIGMRFKHNHKHNKELFILFENFLDLLNKPENEDCKLSVEKLSILHHWSQESFSKSEARYYTELAIDLIKKIPDLDQVVLRSCSSAATKKDYFFVVPKKVKIIGKTQDLQKELPEADGFLFQQISTKDELNGNSITKTYLKYYDLDNKLITKEIMSVPRNKGGNKLSPAVELKLAEEAKIYNLPPLSLASFDKFISEKRQDWLQNKPLSPEDKKIIQAIKPNMRTYEVENFPPGSPADMLDKELKNINRNIEIKAYGGPYKPYTNVGAIIPTSHGHQNIPKGLRKKS